MEMTKLIIFAVLVTISSDKVFGSIVQTHPHEALNGLKSQDRDVERRNSPAAPTLQPQDRTMEKIKAGVEAGKAIIDVLASRNSSSLFSNIASLAKNIAPFLGAIGPLFGFLNFFIPKGPSVELQYMIEQFSIINTKFDQVFNDLNEIKALIVEKSVKQQYGQYQGVVSTLSGLLSAAIDAKAHNSSNATVKSKEDRFLSSYDKNDIYTAINVLYEGMMGGSTLLISIPDSVRQYTSDDRLKTQNMLKGVLSIIVKGVKVILAYYQMTDDDMSYSQQQTEWTNKIQSVTTHMQTIDTAIYNRWRDQAKLDIDKILEDKTSLSNYYFADYMYSFLSAKYDWIVWFLASYNPILGGDKHWVQVCNGWILFRNHGRNLIISSHVESIPAMDLSYVRNKLNAIQFGQWNNHPFFWGHDRRFDAYDAHTMFNLIPNELTKMCSSVGVIQKSASPSYKSPANRMVIVDRGNFHLHFFR